MFRVFFRYRHTQAGRSKTMSALHGTVGMRVTVTFREKWWTAVTKTIRPSL